MNKDMEFLIEMEGPDGSIIKKHIIETVIITEAVFLGDEKVIDLDMGENTKKCFESINDYVCDYYLEVLTSIGPKKLPIGHKLYRDSGGTLHFADGDAKYTETYHLTGELFNKKTDKLVGTAKAKIVTEKIVADHELYTND